MRRQHYFLILVYLFAQPLKGQVIPLYFDELKNEQDAFTEVIALYDKGDFQNLLIWYQSFTKQKHVEESLLQDAFIQYIARELELHHYASARTLIKEFSARSVTGRNQAYLYLLHSILLDRTGAIDQANIWLEKSKEAFTGLHDDRAVAFCELYKGISLYSSFELSDAVEQFTKTREFFTATFDPNSRYHGYPAYWSGRCNRMLGNHDLALTELDFGTKMMKGNSDLSPLADAYRQKAYLLGDKGDIPQALEVCEKAEQMIISRFGQGFPELASMYNAKGNLNGSQDRYDLSLVYWQKAYEIFLATVGPQHNNTIGLLMNVGVAQKELKNYEAALKTYRKCAGMLAKNKVVSYDNYKVNRNIGLIYEIYGDTSAAKKYFQSSLQAGETALEEFSVDWIDAYLDLARVETDPIQSIEYCKDAYKRLDLSVPQLELITKKDFGEIRNPQYFTRVLLDQTKYTYDLYKKSNDKENLISAYDLAQKGVAYIEYAKYRLPSKSSLAPFYSLSKSHFDHSLDIIYDLQKSDDSKEYVASAFNIMEKSKSWTLLASLNQRSVLQEVNVPDSLMNLELSLLSRIDEDYQALNTEDINEDEISRLRLKILNNKEHLEKLHSRLEQEFPGYSLRRTRSNVASLADLQEYLSSRDEVLIQYHLTDHHIYTAYAAADTAVIISQKRPSSLNQDVIALNTWLSTKSSELEAYHQLIEGLSTSLMAPLSELLKDKKSIIVVQDGVLHYVPFDLLLIDPSSNRMLIENCNVAYTYSGSILIELQSKRKHNNRILALAPQFEGVGNFDRGSINNEGVISADIVRGELSPLAGAKEEVLDIVSTIPGQNWMGTAAGESRFKSQSNEFGILHFATHAVIDNTYPMSSYLALEGSAGDDGFLYAWEINNSRLSADLAVLSACNSGFGKLQDGEGMLSLGRSFIEAGCQSVVMSLWPAQDQSTSSIMSEFYKNLASGQPKHQALREAKLFYLNNRDKNLRHPFYWAGFIINGNTVALNYTVPYKYLPVYIGLGVCFLFLGIFLFRNRFSA